VNGEERIKSANGFIQLLDNKIDKKLQDIQKELIKQSNLQEGIETADLELKEEENQ